MRVVLDEGVPRQVVQALRLLGVDAFRFDKDWRGKSNGVLIALVEAHGYDVLLTSDRNMADQQSLRQSSIAIVALPLNRRSAVLDRVVDIADTVRRAKPRQHIVMGLDGSRTAKALVEGNAVVEHLPNIAPFEG